MSPELIVRPLAQRDYLPVWEEMRVFTDARNGATPDEIWLIEHPPVYTLGQNGRREHVLNPGDIPIIPVDRGGQVTYHGPGQLMLYALIDLRRLKMGVRDLVTALEQSVIKMLADYDIAANARCDAPGVYVKSGAKICSLGLRVRRGCSYHGLALNVDMDLTPFSGINPCGYKDLAMTQISQEGGPRDLVQVGDDLVRHFTKKLMYTTPTID